MVYKSLVRPQSFLGKLRTRCEVSFSTSNLVQNIIATSCTYNYTRLSNNGVLIPRAHTNMMSRSFRYTGAVMWNSLPDDIKAINRESTFRTALKTFFNNNRY